MVTPAGPGADRAWKAVVRRASLLTWWARCRLRCWRSAAVALQQRTVTPGAPSTWPVGQTRLSLPRSCSARAVGSSSTRSVEPAGGVRPGRRSDCAARAMLRSMGEGVCAAARSLASLTGCATAASSQTASGRSTGCWWTCPSTPPRAPPASKIEFSLVNDLKRPTLTNAEVLDAIAEPCVPDRAGPLDNVETNIPHQKSQARASSSMEEAT